MLAHRVIRPIETLIVRTDFPDNELETTLYIRRGCLDAASEIACNRESGDGLAPMSALSDPTPGEYYVFVDGAGGRGGRFAVTIEEVPRGMFNGEDDDGAASSFS